MDNKFICELQEKLEKMNVELGTKVELLIPAGSNIKIFGLTGVKEELEPLQSKIIETFKNMTYDLNWNHPIGELQHNGNVFTIYYFTV